MRSDEVECLSSYLATLKSDMMKVEPITTLVGTWLLSAAHATTAGVWQASPLFGLREAPSTGDIPKRFHVNSSPEIMARCARKFIIFQWRTRSPLFEDAQRIIEKLTQRWPTSFRQWTSHELERLSDELRKIPHPPFELPKDAEFHAQFAEKKASYFAELARLERLECQRLGADELIAGSEQLPERGTHLQRFLELVQEAGTLGAKGEYLRFSANTRNDFANFVATLIRRNLRESFFSLGNESQNAVRSVEAGERLLKAIFGEGHQ